MMKDSHKSITLKLNVCQRVVNIGFLLLILKGLPSENKTIDSFCGLDRFKPGLTYESKGTNTLTLVLRTNKEVPKRGFVAIVQGMNLRLKRRKTYIT